MKLLEVITNYKKEVERMKKPTNYETTEIAGEFTPLKPGGHICKIMQVKETKSRNSNLDMLEISLDIAEGEQKDYYAKAYRSDNRTDKKWGCVVYMVVDESTDYGVKNLKTFTTSVEKSNNGFQVAWGDNFAKCFANKLVGGVFGREQYLNNNNEPKWSTKCKWFRSIDSIKAGVDVPEDKFLTEGQGQTSQNQGQLNYGNDGFTTAENEELPFMS